MGVFQNILTLNRCEIKTPRKMVFLSTQNDNFMVQPGAEKFQPTK